MEQGTVKNDSISLKTISQSLNETSELLGEILGKLDYVVSGNQIGCEDVPNTPMDFGTIDHISSKMYEIAIRTSEINKLTNRITGN